MAMTWKQIEDKIAAMTPAKAREFVYDIVQAFAGDPGAYGDDREFISEVEGVISSYGLPSSNDEVDEDGDDDDEDEENDDA